MMVENDNERSIADILRSSMIELRDSNRGVYQKMIEVADKGFFEQHQTAGSLKSLADSLINIPSSGEAGGENKQH